MEYSTPHLAADLEKTQVELPDLGPSSLVLKEYRSSQQHHHHQQQQLDRRADLKLDAKQVAKLDR